MSDKYWEIEEPKMTDDGRRRYKYYKQSGILEISTLLQEDGSIKEVRRQAISAFRLKCNIPLRNMILDFLEDAEVIIDADKFEAME